MNSSKLMSRITAVILVGFILYIAALAFGALNGDITVVLLLLTVITFVYWLYDKVTLKPKRIKEALALEAQIRAQNKGLDEQALSAKVNEAKSDVLMPPWWIEWTAGFFWVIFIVFTVRSFIIEPYRIPSGSMMPTLEAGDFILVSKSSYGIRLPVINTQIVEFSKPERGDVVVFNSPVENLILIKRIVGLPGDRIVYQDKQLTINGELISLTQIDDYLNTEGRVARLDPQYAEQLGPDGHNILRHPYGPGDNITTSEGYRRYYAERLFPENCTYRGADFTCIVPEGHYFMMGDNRDFSLDSRYWGFVPEENIIGKAFFIWLNVGKFSRIGSFK